MFSLFFSYVWEQQIEMDAEAVKIRDRAIAEGHTVPLTKASSRR